MALNGDMIIKMFGGEEMKHEHRSKSADGELRLCYGGWDRDLEPGIRYGPVIRDTYIVECCTGGYGSVIINGTEFAVKGGDCYFLLPGDTVIHTAAMSEPRRGVFCSLEGLQIGTWLAKAGISSSAPFAPQSSFPPLTQVVEKLVTMAEDADPGAQLRQRGCIYELFGLLLSFTGAKEEKSDPMRKVFRLIETRYHDPLTVNDLAREAGLERCYFSTTFKASTGLSPYQYLCRFRIRKACALMEHTLCDVTTASVSVGIPPENFSRMFKKWMGITPAAFRKAVVSRGRTS